MLRTGAAAQQARAAPAQSPRKAVKNSAAASPGTAHRKRQLPDLHASADESGNSHGQTRQEQLQAAASSGDELPHHDPNLKSKQDVNGLTVDEPARSRSAVDAIFGAQLRADTPSKLDVPDSEEAGPVSSAAGGDSPGKGTSSKRAQPLTAAAAAASSPIAKEKSSTDQLPNRRQNLRTTAAGKAWNPELGKTGKQTSSRRQPSAEPADDPGSNPYSMDIADDHRSDDQAALPKQPARGRSNRAKQNQQPSLVAELQPDAGNGPASDGPSSDRPVKRARGRPPKAQTSKQQDLPNNTASQKPNAKGMTANGKSLQASSPVKRGKGRPPKGSRAKSDPDHNVPKAKADIKSPQKKQAAATNLKSSTPDAAV